MGRRLICGAMIAAALAVATAREAKACGQGGANYGSYAALGVGAIVVGLTDVGMTIADLATLGGPRSATYGGVELAIATPQLLVGIYGLTQGGQSASFFAGYTLWMAALFAHGIWTIHAAHTADSGPGIFAPPPEPPSDGGVKMVFGPTYVPLGPLAQVGFGLSGRF